MERNDRKRFKTEIQKLAAAFPREEIGEVTYEVFWEDLEEFPLDIVTEALRMARRESGWFPKIRDIREIAVDLTRRRPTDAPRIEDRRDDEPFADPNKVREFIASLDKQEVGKGVPADTGSVKSESSTLDGDEATRFEEKRRKAKAKAKAMGWGV